jgi:peptidoglycan hydrolase CwlO-like protein
MRSPGVGSAQAGNAVLMTESASGDDPGAALEREADELEHHLDELDNQITDAQKAAEARREDLDPSGGDD